jgi:hypothetical protein
LGRSLLDTASYLAEEFRRAGRLSPLHQQQRQDILAEEIANLIRAWGNSDPPVRRNCAITPKHLRTLHLAAAQRQSPLLRALAHLITGAFFFACRSCEYVKVNTRGKTKLLQLHNILFTDKDYKAHTHNDPNLLAGAEYVTITFTDQKNNHKNESRTQQRNSDHTLCPVRSWVTTVRRIVRYPNAGPNTTVNTFLEPNHSTPRYLTQNDVNTLLRYTINKHTPEYFGYHHGFVGTHSIRSGAAMALYLATGHPHRIMLLGIWSSDAFLLYLRPEVMSSSARLSQNMLLNDDFRQAQTQAQDQTSHSNDRIHPAVSLQRGDSRSIISAPRSGYGGAENASRITMPRFHMFH